MPMLRRALLVLAAPGLIPLVLAALATAGVIGVILLGAIFQAVAR